MSDFSDCEDRHLVQLAKGYEDRGERVSWAAVAKSMKDTKKDARALKTRLATLKTTNGKLLRDFPPWFFKGTSDQTAKRRRQLPIRPSPIPLAAKPGESTGRSPSCTVPTPIARSIGEFVAKEAMASHPRLVGSDHLDAVEITVATSTNAADEPLCRQDAYDLVGRIFRSVSRADVLQVAGRSEFNVGELSVEGVSDLVQHCRLNERDVLLDLGCGVGNVVVQAALESRVARSVGIEIREDLASLASKTICDAMSLDARLNKAAVFHGDASKLEHDWSAVATTTVLYTCNILFTPSATLAIIRLCCMIPSLRLVVLGVRVCPRHRRHCINEFCLVWIEETETLSLQTEFRAAPQHFYSYVKRR